MANPADSNALYIGLMSGTSIDGVDAALVRFGDRQCDVVCTHKHSYPDLLRSELLDATRNPADFSVDKLGSLDHQVAECFAAAVDALVENSGFDKDEITAIGSHGQTVRHQPKAEWPFTLQLGDPNRIAARTGITTVADFRRRDVALGGEGAPLAPAFHQWLFAGDDNNAVVLNIGGIANVTILAGESDATVGFDTGPGNTLLDAWIGEHQSKEFDDDGAWAASGNTIDVLLETLLDDPYLSAPPPKSTGVEYFNVISLRRAIDASSLRTAAAANDVQATLVEFTARSATDAIRAHAPDASRVVVCGGGVHNSYLMSRIEAHMRNVPVLSTNSYRIDPDWVEAAAFAWLAMRTMGQCNGNLPSVTGASAAAVLGGIFFGTS